MSRQSRAIQLAVAKDRMPIAWKDQGAPVHEPELPPADRDLTLHCLRLDMAFHHARTPGQMIERVDGDVGLLGNFFSLRIGEFRVLYNVDEQVRIVAIQRIGEKRRDEFFFRGRQEEL
jgi:hypothetical protein